MDFQIFSVTKDGHIALANKQKSLILIKFNNGKKFEITLFITDQKRTFFFCICGEYDTGTIKQVEKEIENKNRSVF